MPEHRMAVGDIYRCEICGNVVQVTHAGGGALICCNYPMVLLGSSTPPPASFPEKGCTS